MQREDLALASKVASGALRASKLVRCLVSSSFDKQSCMQRGHCVRTGNADEETMRELFFALSYSSSTKALLREFEVSMTCQSKIDFRLQIVPWPFLSHLDKKRACVVPQRSACSISAARVLATASCRWMRRAGTQPTP